MTSTLGLIPAECHADQALLDALTPPKFHADQPSVDAIIRPTDRDGILKRPSFGKRARLSRFLIIFCIGVAATLAWQSYGNMTREIIASSSPQFGWLAPQAAAPEQIAPNMVAPTAAAAPYSNVQQLATMLHDLTTVRQSLDQLTTRQQQVADAIDKLQATEQVSAPSSQPSAAPARKPVPVRPLSSWQAPRVH